MAGRKVFTAGEVLQAADVNDFLMDQSVMVFAGTAARGSAIPSPTEGMVTYRSDDDLVEVFDGSSFKPVGTILQVVAFETAATTTTTSATPVATSLVSSITPSSISSKVLIQVSAGRLFSTTTGGRAQLRLFRGGVSDTALGVNDIHSATFTAVGAGQNEGTGSIVFLDSPATTSSQTYTVGISTSGAGNSVSVASQQTMILMEVAG